MTDPYSVLEVSRDASDDEIKKAYRNLRNPRNITGNSGIADNCHG